MPEQNPTPLPSPLRTAMNALVRQLPQDEEKVYQDYPMWTAAEELDFAIDDSDSLVAALQERLEAAEGALTEIMSMIDEAGTELFTPAGILLSRIHAVVTDALDVLPPMPPPDMDTLCTHCVSPMAIPDGLHHNPRGGKHSPCSRCRDHLFGMPKAVANG